ncbi:hypothetical protein [Halomonas sp. WWR20]
MKNGPYEPLPFGSQSAHLLGQRLAFEIHETLLDLPQRAFHVRPDQSLAGLIYVDTV